jgi:hypothetical protein
MGSAIRSTDLSSILQLPLNALNSFTLFDFLDDALADAFCLKTYNHGTSPKNYYNIVWSDANPAEGGKDGPGKKEFDQFIGWTRTSTKGKFCVIKDGCAGGLSAKTYIPRFYALRTSIAESIDPNEEGAFSKVKAFIKGTFLSMFSPTLKFRFIPGEDQGFKDDNIYLRNIPLPDVGAFTKEHISSEHIGLYGTLSQGLKGGLFGRIQNDPSRFAAGLLKLTLVVVSVALLSLGCYYFPAMAIGIVGSWLLYEAAIAIGSLSVPLICGYFNSSPEFVLNT